MFEYSAFFLILAIVSVVLVLGSETLIHENQKGYFTVDLSEFRNFEEQRSLGIHLTEKNGMFIVKDFEIDRTTGQRPWIHTTGGVIEGDIIVSVDEQDLKTNKLRDLAKSITVAKSVTFFRDIIASQKKVLLSTPPHKMGRMDVLHSNIVLFSLPLSVAEFSSESGSLDCAPKPLIFADPENGCFSQNLDHEKINGSYFIAERGGCSFSAKALNAESRGAMGSIVINDMNSSFEMPTDPEYASGKLSIPAVMISSSHGMEIKRSTNSVGEQKLYGRFVISSKCLKEDALHKKQVEQKNARGRALTAVTDSTDDYFGKTSDSRVAKTQHILSNTIFSDQGIEERTQLTSRNEVKAGELIVDEEHFEFLLHVSNILPNELLETNTSLYFLSTEKNCTNLRVNDRDKYMLEKSMIFIKDNCDFRNQIILASDAGAAAVVLYLSEGHPYKMKNGFDIESADKMLVQIECAKRTTIAERGECLNEDNGFEKSKRALMRETKLSCTYDIETQIVVVVVSSRNAMRLVTRARSNANEGNAFSEHLVAELKPDNFVAHSWSVLNELSKPWLWPNSSKQRRRLFLKQSKLHDKRMYPDRFEALNEFYQAAELYNKV